MRIELSATPHRVEDLLRFLRRMGYLADETSYGVVRVDEHALPQSAFGVPAVALALRLQVWNTVNGAQARLTQLTGALEP